MLPFFYTYLQMFTLTPLNKEPYCTFHQCTWKFPSHSLYHIVKVLLVEVSFRFVLLLVLH